MDRDEAAGVGAVFRTGRRVRAERAGGGVGEMPNAQWPMPNRGNETHTICPHHEEGQPVLFAGDLKATAGYGNGF